MGVRVPILTYHKILPLHPDTIYPGTFVPPKLFRQHLRHLAKRGFQTGRLDQLFSPGSPSKPVILTFDDGFQDFEDNAFPLLQEHKMAGTVFLVSNQIGKTNEWDEKIGDVAYPLMDKESILRLHAQGIEFGSHTLSHARLTSEDADTQSVEIKQSKADLETLLGFPITTFCYPYGSYNDVSVRLVREAGYTHATTCEKGLNDGSEDSLLLKRIAIRNDTSLPIFVYKLWRAFRFGR